MTALIGLDVGTTGCKAVVFSEEGVLRPGVAFAVYKKGPGRQHAG